MGLGLGLGLGLGSGLARRLVDVEAAARGVRGHRLQRLLGRQVEVGDLVRVRVRV